MTSSNAQPVKLADEDLDRIVGGENPNLTTLHTLFLKKDSSKTSKSRPESAGSKDQ